MKKLIAGNWKMNGSLAVNQALIQDLVQGIAQTQASANHAAAVACDVAICVPTAYLDQISKLFSALTQANPAQSAMQLIAIIIPNNPTDARAAQTQQRII